MIVHGNVKKKFFFVFVCTCTGAQILNDVVEQCKAANKDDDPFQTFKCYVLIPKRPSTTLYVLEVGHSSCNN